MSYDSLRVVWFILIGMLLTAYAILDGFDLGVGVLSPFVAKSDRERRLLFNAIGPFWDGNEVWLLTAGGALFAAFPHVYATVFSGFYLALMLVLFALIFRAVAFEFRSKIESAKWRKAWDGAFFVGSLVPALLTGVALGNVLRGVPLDADMEYAGTFLTLLNPYSLLVGSTGLAMFITHGALYLLIKTEGEVAARARKWAHYGWLSLTALIGITLLLGIADTPVLWTNYLDMPVLFMLPALLIVFLAGSRLSLSGGAYGRAFLFSSLTIASLLGIAGAANFPYLVRARNVADWGLSIYNASSSQTTLMTMFIIALIGVPLVLIYTAYVYRVFRGVTQVEESGY